VNRFLQACSAPSLDGATSSDTRSQIGAFRGDDSYKVELAVGESLDDDPALKLGLRLWMLGRMPPCYQSEA
jgi:hypothetical protein